MADNDINSLLRGMQGGQENRYIGESTLTCLATSFILNGLFEYILSHKSTCFMRKGETPIQSLFDLSTVY